MDNTGDFYRASCCRKLLVLYCLWYRMVSVGVFGIHSCSYTRMSCRQRVSRGRITNAKRPSNAHHQERSVSYQGVGEGLTPEQRDEGKRLLSQAFVRRTLVCKSSSFTFLGMEGEDMLAMRLLAFLLLNVQLVALLQQGRIVVLGMQITRRCSSVVRRSEGTREEIVNVM